MPTATPADLRIVEAYIVCGSGKAAAASLGIRPDTYRHRLSRIYVRFAVTNMGQLVHLLAGQLECPTDAGVPSR
jgi:hypothetical protein